MARRLGHRVGLIYLDLDRFKDVNDTYGHRVGDLLLAEMAARTRHCLRASDLLAHIGGDEFIALLPDIRDVVAVHTVVDKIERALAAPFELSEIQCTTVASFGLAIYPDDATESVSLIAVADRRMYAHKYANRAGALPAVETAQ